MSETDDLELLRTILDVNWTIEATHDHDCPACDIAADIAGTFAVAWEEGEDWDTLQVDSGLPGDTKLDQAMRIASYVLHRRLHNYRPSIDEITARREKVRGDQQRSSGGDLG